MLLAQSGRVRPTSGGLHGSSATNAGCLTSRSCVVNGFVAVHHFSTASYGWISLASTLCARACARWEILSPIMRDWSRSMDDNRGSRRRSCPSYFLASPYSSAKTSKESAPPLTIMAPRPRTSAAGVLALLSEPDQVLQQHALRSLNSLVPQFWAEISEYIPPMYALSFPRSCYTTSLFLILEKSYMKAMHCPRTPKSSLRLS